MGSQANNMTVAMSDVGFRINDWCPCDYARDHMTFDVTNKDDGRHYHDDRMHLKSLNCVDLIFS